MERTMKWLCMINMTKTPNPNTCTVNQLQTGSIICHVLLKKMATWF